MRRYRFILVFISFLYSCSAQEAAKQIIPGAYQQGDYLPNLKGQKVGLLVNHTSMIGPTHLVDSLLKLNINITRVFTPEHGFRGKAADGELIQYDAVDLPYKLISLYGKNRKPSAEQLNNIDVLVIDLQDVGVRFYTYASTMTYVMEGCAQQNIKVIVLDRPNPNGSYVDGPVLQEECKSFIGLHPIPIIHGLTLGELAMMINDEGWLGHGVYCPLTVVTVRNWDHSMPYNLPIGPSPNLPNTLAASLYPSLGLFEGTVVSVGRGTPFPFQVFGHPGFQHSSFTFTPQPNEGSKYPPLEGQQCYGMSFEGTTPVYAFTLKYLIDSYKELYDQIEKPFFNDYFKLLAGNNQLQQQIEAGWTEEQIKASWSEALNTYKRLREKYLLYED